MVSTVCDCGSCWISSEKTCDTLPCQVDSAWVSATNYRSGVRFRVVLPTTTDVCAVDVRKCSKNEDTRRLRTRTKIMCLGTNSAPLFRFPKSSDSYRQNTTAVREAVLSNRPIDLGLHRVLHVIEADRRRGHLDFRPVPFAALGRASSALSPPAPHGRGILIGVPPPPSYKRHPQRQYKKRLPRPPEE